MLHFRALFRAICLLSGAALSLLGLTWLVIAWAGSVRSGQLLAIVAGAALLLVAAPLVVFFFSARRAKLMAVIVLILLALSMLWLAFHSGDPIDRPMLAQAAAIAFAVLLLARVGLALRRNYLRRGT